MKLSELKKLCGEATEERWEGCTVSLRSSGDDEEEATRAGEVIGDLIIEARHALPALIEMVERLEAENAALRKVEEAARDSILGNELITSNRFPAIRKALAELDRVREGE